MSAKGERHFTVSGSDVGVSGGTYTSDSPYAAAKKAASQISRKHKNVDKFKFILREKTQGSSKKSFFYEATIEHLKTPIETPWKKADGSPVFKTKKVHLKTCHGDELKSVHTAKH